MTRLARGLPSGLAVQVEELFSVTDAFCAKHLDNEYSELVAKVIAKLARKRPSPLARGDLRAWGAAAVHAVGSVNFLFDPSQRPHLTVDQLSSLTCVPKSTMANKARAIRDILRLREFDPECGRRPFPRPFCVRRCP